jgi:hypothetical protein
MQMGEIVGLISKSERERLRFIREARAIYDSIFPPNDAADEQSDERTGKNGSTGQKRLAPSKGDAR